MYLESCAWIYEIGSDFNPNFSLAISYDVLSGTLVQHRARQIVYAVYGTYADFFVYVK